MPLTTAQQSTLKAAVIADATLNAQPHTADGAFAIADALNLQASPVFTVWKTNVPITTVGDNFVGTELAGLSSLNQTRLQTIAQFSLNGINPSLADRRAFFDDVFSGAGGALTRAKLLTLWKRTATRVEKILSTGTGTDVAPATMGYEGTVNYLDVFQAMGW